MIDSDNGEKGAPTEKKASFAKICFTIFAVLFTASHVAHSDDMGFPSKAPFLHMYVISLAAYLLATFSRCIRLSKEEGDVAAVIDFALMLLLLIVLIFLGAWAAAGIQLAVENS